MALIPKCLNCGTELEEDDVLDMDYDDDGIELFCIGGCPNCGNIYQWNRTASIQSWEIENLKEN